MRTDLPVPPIVKSQRRHNYTLMYKARIVCCITTKIVLNPTIEMPNYLHISVCFLT